MGSINDTRKRLSVSVLKEQAALALDDNRVKIIDLEVDQLKHGLRADGTKIGKYKNPKYAALKFAENPLAGYGNADWIKTGQLKNELFVDVRPEVYVIDSADPKTAYLIETYGDPLGLTDESKNILINEGLAQSYVTRVKQKLQL